MSTATLEGHTVLALSLHIPAWGMPWADVELSGEAELSGGVELVVGDLTLTCAVMSGGPWQGRSRYRVAGGAGGWGTAIAAASYSNDAGVKLSKVIGDAASACGETFDADTAGTTRVGSQWAREAGPASRSLALLARQAWYVDTDGTTKLGARSAVDFEGAYTLERHDQDSGVLVLATDALAQCLPGVTIEGVEAVDVVHTIEDSTLRTTLYSATRSATSRLAGSLVRLVDAITARTRYHALWSYRVVAQSSERFDLQSERSASGMPDLQRVRIRPGVAGCRADVVLGSMCLVAFINGDPGRPAVVGWDDPESDGFPPDRLDLVGEDDAAVAPPDALGRVVRYGDSMVFAIPGPGTLVMVPAGGTASRVRA